jgi:CD2 antigen cytoplasmic tail-binding protein 2
MEKAAAGAAPMAEKAPKEEPLSQITHSKEQQVDTAVHTESAGIDKRLLKQHHTPIIKRASLTPQAQLEFDQLTDLSSVLMESGEFLIHSQPREELLKNIQQQNRRGNTNDGGEEKSREERNDGGGGGGSDSNGNGSAAAAAVIDNEDDVDMFAADDDTEEATKEETNTEEQEKQTALEESAQPDVPTAIPQPPQRPEESQEQLLQGFILDETSGYYYNSTLGAYYDPVSSLFGDAASGRWYRLDQNTGQYILV